jgi:hypothetical protein
MIYANDKTLSTNVVPFVPSSANAFSSVLPDGGVSTFNYCSLKGQ